MAYPIYKNTAWFPPDQVNVSIQDIGFLRGFGIFDFFRIMDGKPIFLSDHLDRLLASAQKMGIVHNYTKAHLANLILELASKSVDKCLGVKMILTAGDSPNGFDVGPIANLYILPTVFSFLDPELGMKLMSLKYQREMADIKSLNYAFALRNWAEVKAKGFDDVIYYHNTFGVSESSRSNLFFVKNGIFYTPKSHILEGITRKHVIKLIQSNYSLELGDFSLEAFKDADEVFTTGSTKRVLPITQIDDQLIHSGKRGPYTQEIYELLLNSES
jgi:D-alanine transaminase/branched-chain amino acid aminotransferase